MYNYLELKYAYYVDNRRKVRTVRTSKGSLL